MRIELHDVGHGLLGTRSKQFVQVPFGMKERQVFVKVRYCSSWPEGSHFVQIASFECAHRSCLQLMS
jgi:hypothetical protein